MNLHENTETSIIQIDSITPFTLSASKHHVIHVMFVIIKNSTYVKRIVHAFASKMINIAYRPT